MGADETPHGAQGSLDDFPAASYFAVQK